VIIGQVSNIPGQNVCLKDNLPMLNEELVKEAISSGAQYAVIIDTKDINFHQEFRKACERNACGRFNTNWMGPPAIGPVNDLIEKVRKYPHGLLFQTVHQVNSSFDMKSMAEGVKKHEAVFRDLLAKIKAGYRFKEILPLNAGCCRICERCAYLDGQPCRNPDKAVSSLEAYGMDVAVMQKNAGIPYYTGKNSISFVGLILFNE
jgi:predicted metal-binding protein